MAVDYTVDGGAFEACPSPKIHPCTAAHFSARIDESHARHHSEYVSVCSIARQWSSRHRCRESSSAEAAGCVQEEAEKARADPMGPAVLGRFVAALERLAGCAGFCSAG